MLLSDEDGCDEREDRYGVVEDACLGGAEVAHAEVVEGVGEGGATDAEGEEEEEHLGRIAEERQVAAVKGEYEGKEVDKSDEVLPCGDGEWAVAIHDLDEEQSVYHRYGHGPCEEEQALCVAAEGVAAEDEDEDTAEGEDDTAYQGQAYAFAVGHPHAEGHEEWYGGYDDGGEAAADELDAAGLAEVVDEGFAECEEEEPLEVAVQQ